MLKEYKNLEQLLGSSSLTTSLSACTNDGCLFDASDCEHDCSSDCSSDCSKDCSSDCSKDCSSDCSDCSDSPVYYKITVETRLNGDRYDLSSDTFESGTKKTISGWMTAVGVSKPSGTFEYAYVGSSSTQRPLSYSVTLTSNISISVFYSTSTPIDPVIITSASVSPTELVLGTEIEISWSYSGTKDSSGSWYLYRTDSSSFTNPTSIGNPSQSDSSFSMIFGKEGTYYIWVRYYGSTQGWSETKCAGRIVVSGTSQTFKLTVTVKKNGVIYDSGTVSNIVGGTSKTMTQWASTANVDFPPSPAIFENYTWGKGTYTDKTMDLTVSSDTTMVINYTEEIIGSRVIIYTNGSWKTATLIMYTNGKWREVLPEINS